MRSLEVALAVLVIAGAVRPLTRWSTIPRTALVLAAATVLAVGGHVLVEGPRWQLTPLYVAAVVTLVAAVRVATGDATDLPSRRRGRWLGVAGLAVLGVAVGLALPVLDLPLPGGASPVGTTVVALRDSSRTEFYGPSPGGPRELVAQVWYPADETGERAPWIGGGVRFGRAAARELGLPPFALDHLGLVRSNASLDVAPSSELTSLPVVVHAHGWSGFRTVQADLAEELASQGYVVVALDHTYGAIATSFPDGHVVAQDASALPDGVAQERYDAAAERLVATFAADLSFALDALADGEVPLLDGRLALDRVALMGHSTGGGAAIRACAEDRRCVAVVGFDPWVEPVSDDTIGAGLEVPLLSLRSEEWVGNDNDARLRRLHAASPGPAGLVAIAGTTHRDFTLLPYLTPLSRPLGLSGPTPGARTHEVVESWTLAFLDAHLRGTGVDPLERPPDLPEATIDG